MLFSFLNKLFSQLCLAIIHCLVLIQKKNHCATVCAKTYFYSYIIAVYSSLGDIAAPAPWGAASFASLLSPLSSEPEPPVLVSTSVSYTLLSSLWMYSQTRVVELAVNLVNPKFYRKRCHNTVLY